MNVVHALKEAPSAELASALRTFESEFRYPLGESEWFRISHGDDYTQFFRAIGDTRCFVAVRDGAVGGVISIARCGLRIQGGDRIEAAYIADLKLRQPPVGRTLLGLLREAVQWGRGGASKAGFSIVMDGTNRRPTSYTGRLGIPTYGELARLTILRIPALSTAPESGVRDSPLDEVQRCFEELTDRGIAILGGDPFLRSAWQPRGLLLSNGRACGVLEDTFRCKRLFDQDGNEMLSAHLSLFGYQSTEDAVSLLKFATNQCHLRGLPAMFVAVPRADSDSIVRRLGSANDIVTAPATIFGTGLPDSLDWYVNTAEI
ncbi:hypothetical protein [Allorhodopirellula heiligendammensis]|uniref:N-acetyltransferase domain-containing protein n=1 Tax=Allorhodopirellula heiligendammensis TaxID=2714739 RepID=A0A5C6BHI2_9BACT|nr:hypothetical protein [Allorhodopirellula heiligendammensis]TWU11137.1 hypothetical protein Poly21_50440 [Allorhodopirellula heiligendammensis]